MKVQWLCHKCGHEHGTKDVQSYAVMFGRCSVCQMATSVSKAERYGVTEIEEKPDHAENDSAIRTLKINAIYQNGKRIEVDDDEN